MKDSLSKKDLQYIDLARAHRQDHACTHGKNDICKSCDPYTWDLLRRSPAAVKNKGKPPVKKKTHSDCRLLLEDVRDELAAWNERYGPDNDTQGLLERIADHLERA